ncbi:MAG TPA: hypothetical protein DEU72_02095 [Desulfomicrobiaceae bacterium]|nr:hypothetical protein [Desulfomicrobiaceae bacterium]
MISPLKLVRYTSTSRYLAAISANFSVVASLSPMLMGLAMAMERSSLMRSAPCAISARLARRWFHEATMSSRPKTTTNTTAVMAMSLAPKERLKSSMTAS